MSKQLTPLEALEDLKCLREICLGSSNFDKRIEIIETALKRLEEIDKYNIASGVGKSLEIIKYNLSEDGTSDLPEALEKVCIACLKLAMLELKLGKDQLALKKLKALEIIKEKRPDTHFLFSCDSEKEYNEFQAKRYGDYASCIHLTKEQFDLLKEMLCK